MKKVVIGLMVCSGIFFAGCSNNDSASNQEQSPSSSSKSGSVFEMTNKPPKTGDDQLDSEIETLGQQYDELTDRAKGFNNAPSTYTQDEQIRFLQDQTTTTNTFNSVMDKLQNNDSSSNYLKVSDFVQRKNTQLLQEVSKLSEASGEQTQ